MIPALEEALALRADGPGQWLAFTDPRHESISAMFGGWTAAVALGAVVRSAGSEVVPAALTINFIDKVTPGHDVRIVVERLGGGRSIEHWRAEMRPIAGEGVLASAMVTMANRRPSDGHIEPSMPHAPDPESLVKFHAPGSQGEQTLIRPITGNPIFARPDTSSSAWVRELSGRAVDHVQLAYLADQYAPRSFCWSEGPRPSATITLSVYFHGTPEEIAAVGDDYVLTEAIGTRGALSTSGQQARLWSRQGHRLATTEQLCWYR